MLRAVTLFATLTLATAAQAQQQPATRCGWEGGQWVCRQDRSPGNVLSNWKFTDTGERMRQAYERSQLMTRDAEATNAARAATEQQMLTRQVSTFVADGRCEDAKLTALRGGDMALAEQAMRLCEPR